MSVDTSLRGIAGGAAPTMCGDPDSAVLVDGEPVGRSPLGRREDAPVHTTSSGLDVVDENLAAGAVALEDPPPIGRKADPVAHAHVVIELRDDAIGRDPIELTGWLRTFAGEGIEAHRSDDDRALGIRE